MSMSETGFDVIKRLVSSLLSATQRGAIVGEMESVVWNLCCFLHLVDGEAFLDQLLLLLRLPVVVEIDSSTGHCIPTHASRIDSVLALLLVIYFHLDPAG